MINGSFSSKSMELIDGCEVLNDETAILVSRMNPGNFPPKEPMIGLWLLPQMEEDRGLFFVWRRGSPPKCYPLIFISTQLSVIFQ